MRILNELKQFALRGNVADMAIGIIIGAAFNGFVQSLVNDILMPPFAFILGRVDLSNLFIVLREGAAISGPYFSAAEAKAAGAVTLNYGIFINSIISFLIVSFAVFMLVRAMNRLRAKEKSPPPSAEPPRQEQLLAEIRDILKQQRG